jgi:hypothetical protein
MSPLLCARECACVDARVYVREQTYARARDHCVFARVCVREHACERACACARARLCAGVRARVVCMCLCLYMCVCGCARLLLYVHAPRRLEQISRARRHRRLLHLLVPIRVRAYTRPCVCWRNCAWQVYACASVPVCVRARAECLEAWLLLIIGFTHARACDGRLSRVPRKHDA